MMLRGRSGFLCARASILVELGDMGHTAPLLSTFEVKNSSHIFFITYLPSMSYDFEVLKSKHSSNLICSPTM